jgi:hypothetical protein
VRGDPYDDHERPSQETSSHRIYLTQPESARAQSVGGKRPSTQPRISLQSYEPRILGHQNPIDTPLA